MAPPKRKPGGGIPLANPPAMGAARAGKTRVFHEKLQRFAIAYADPTSKTAGSGVKSYQLIEPGAAYDTAKKQSEKYLRHPKCVEMIEWIRAEAKVASGLTGARFIQECLEVEEKLLERALSGARGASLLAQSAVKYRQLAGKAAGLLIERTEDMTPPERRALGTAEAIRVIEEQWNRVLRLREANPVALPNARGGEVQEADFTIEPAVPQGEGEHGRTHQDAGDQRGSDSGAGGEPVRGEDVSMENPGGDSVLQREGKVGDGGVSV